ncbi:MAG: phosphoribosylanthranilate isomerase [Candidatus Eiseniibacteriota bacterium]
MILSPPLKPAGEPPGLGGPDTQKRTVVKICGLTNFEDARAAVAAGADWLGFVVHPPSPRHIEPERAAEILAALPGAVAVAVMVATSPALALAIARRMRASRVQVHRPPAGWAVDFELPVALVVPVAADGALTETLPDPRHLVMLDTAHAELAGGTGETFPWEAAKRVARERRVLLAGGLGPDNVGDALARVHPFGIDASSSLERAPGLKDRERVRRFVEAARAADAGRGAA